MSKANANMFEPDWNGCIIVFGKPGVGKTAFLTAVAVQYLNASADSVDLYNQCRAEVQMLRDCGYRYELPEQAPVYSNYPIKVHLGNGKYAEPYYIDGFGFGFETNNEKPMKFPVYPFSRVILTEGQRYYNSRRSKDLPDWVSRLYEERRHFGLLILIDTQRPDLIDVNIRDTASEFYEVERIEVIEDKNGVGVATQFTLRVFTDWKSVDAYKTSTKAKGYTIKKMRFDFNVFEYYQSQVYYKSFLPKVDFSRIRHVESDNKDEDNELFKILYRQTPPEGFYPVKKGR